MANEDGLTATEADSQTVLGAGLSSEESAPKTEESAPEAPDGSVETPAEGSVEQLPKWTEQLPREYRDKFTGFDSYKEFVNAAAEALELKDKAIVKPAEDASPEEWARFYAAVGRPDEPDGYDLDETEGELVGAFKTKAHELGLTTAQAKELFAWYGEQQKAAKDAAQKQIAESAEQVRAQLREEWKDQYDAQMKNIERFAKKYGSEELTQELANPDVGNNPVLIKTLAKAGADLASDDLIEGKPVVEEKKPRGHLEYSWMRDAYPKRPE